MGGTLSSPLGSRPHHHPHHGGHHHHNHHLPQSTSVCNHLFSPPESTALYLSSTRTSNASNGWPTNWQRKNVHPEERKIALSNGEVIHSNHSRASFISPPTRRELPYTSLSLNLDTNSNYAGFTPRSGTVIPNLYSLAKEDDRCMSVRSSTRQRHDFANNNFVSPPTSNVATPLSPTHQPLPTRTLISDIPEKELRAVKVDRISSPHEPSVHASLEVRRRTVLHANTSDLLRGLGRFVQKKAKIDNIDAAHVVMWMRAVDRSLLLQGWQDIAFINPANLVFVFLLLRAVDEDDECLESTEGIHQWVLTCLYVAYSYMGNEISYPLKPFLVQKDRPDFWSKCISLTLSMSSDMLRLNSSSSFFSQIFADLKRYAADP